MSNSIRLVLITVVLLLAAFAGVTKKSVSACPTFGVHTYYNNASHSVVVGHITWYCNCTNSGLSGTKTSFVSISPIDCSNLP